MSIWSNSKILENMDPSLSFLELDREKYVRHSVKQYRNHKPVSTDTQRTDVALSRPKKRNLLKSWRGLVHTWNLVDEQGRAWQACREKRSVTLVPCASICRYLFNFSIGKHRHAANTTFSAIWLRRLCHVKAPRYQHDCLMSSSLLSETIPFSLLSYSRV